MMHGQTAAAARVVELRGAGGRAVPPTLARAGGGILVVSGGLEGMQGVEAKVEGQQAGAAGIAQPLGVSIKQEWGV